MNEAIELLSLMSKILCNQNTADIDQLSEKLFSRIKTREFRKALNFSHKNHTKYNIKLKNCDEFHCIECLIEDISIGICKHDKPMTAYEKSLILHLKELYPEVEYHEFLFMKCRQCKSHFETSELCFSPSSCKCPICSKCLAERYKQRELNCLICDSKINKSRIRQIEDFLSITLPVYSKCKSCDLVFEVEALKKKKCYICSSHN